MEELIEDLARELSDRYRDAEDELIRQIAIRAARDLELSQQLTTADAGRGLTVAERRRQNRILAELSAHRAVAIRELQGIAAAMVERLRVADLAQHVVDVAATEGEAAAAAQLGFAARPVAAIGGLTVPASTLTSSAAQSVAMVALSLESRLEVLNQRLTRYPQDAYQRIVSFYSPSTLLGISTSRVQQAQTVQRFLAEGIPSFTDRAGRRWTIGAYAEMAGRTTVNRAFNDAGVWRMQQSGISLVTIVRGLDSCQKCAAWAGKILSTDGTPAGTYELPHQTDDSMVSVTVEGTVDDARGAGWNHPNCFPGFVPVSAPTGVLAADARWFEGEVVVIHTATGRELTVTPNHPVLTTEGWVAAGALVEGHDLVSYRGDVEQPLTSRPDHEGVEAPIGEVYKTLRESGEVTAITMPGTTEDFHGDGTAHAEVDVVLAHGLLGSDGKPTRLQLSPESDLLLGRVRESDLLRVGAALQVFHAAGHPSDDVVSGGGELEPVFGTGLGHAGVHRGRAIADRDASLDEPPMDHIAGDTVIAGEFLDALTGLVSTDQIVNVDRRGYAGHVYNLQTAGAWYTAGSIIVHNCRCRVAPYLAGVTVITDDSTYDEKAEKERAEQRRLEREIRAAKRREVTAMNDTDRARAHVDVREAQSDMREFIRDTGRRRDSYREQLHFADGRRTR
ncbi:phage minor capsid protein [Microbacterium sp. KR10-403]|uniref:phage minor capsid protein n=1 Tax=Microbacterium sp. KR10-403 TaxID=3158581 RepID=UPI0032E45B93